jgi:hypothetical protein
MRKVIVLKDKSEVTIFEMYNFCTKITSDDHQCTNICSTCLEAFKYIYIFLKKCEKTVQILNQQSIVAPLIENSHVTVKQESIDDNVETFVDIERQPEIVASTSESIKHP